MKLQKLNNYRKLIYPGVRKDSYLISENGDIYSLLTDKHLKTYSDKDGYLKINLSGKNIFIHRIVAFHFVPNPNNYPVTDHLDGVKLNNHYLNLEWVTVQENTLRAERLGLRKVRGEDNGNNIYSEELVREICGYYEEGMTVKDVFRHYRGDFTRVSSDKAFYMFLRRLKEKVLWPDVVGEYTYSSDGGSDNRYDMKPTINHVFTENQIHEICKMLERGLSIRDILDNMVGSRDYTKYRSQYEVINMIRHRKNWHYITREYNYTLEGTTDRPKIENSEFYKLSSEGYSVKDMMKMYDIKKVKDNPKLVGKMKRAYEKYHLIKNLSGIEIIKIISD